MLKKHLALALIVVLVYIPSIGSTQADASTQESARARDEMKETLAKFGVGEKARVKVKLRNRSEVKGYVSGVGAENFIVTDKKSGRDITLTYSEVVSIKRDGRSLGGRIAIWSGVGAAALGIYMLVLWRNCCG